MTLKTGLLLVALACGALFIYGIFVGFGHSLQLAFLGGAVVFGGAYAILKNNAGTFPNPKL